MTCFAIGAATWPPVASFPRSPPSSTITPTAMRAVCAGPAGANAVNHAFGGPFVLAEVPVLPATTRPGICAGVPVPLLTTFTIIARSSAAEEEVRGWLYSFGPNEAIVWPVVASRTSVTRRGSNIVPPFAIAAAISPRCNGLRRSLSSPIEERASAASLLS